MMVKRDLEADLGWLSSPICGHILKRAIEAEALARELADALQGIFDGNPHDNYEGWKAMGDKAKRTLDKAKEVLGDE